MATLFESYNSGDDQHDNFNKAKYLAQTFTPQVTHTITSVKLKLWRTDAANGEFVGVYIRTTTGTIPNSIPSIEANLASGSIAGSLITTSAPGAWYEVSLGAGALLTAGTVYAILCTTTDADFDVNWRNGNAYSRGNGAWWTTVSGIWQASPIKDFMFEDWGSGGSPTAAPSVYTLSAQNIDKTTATGGGIVTALGSPVATQHGHVWATHPISTENPYTYYDYIEKGSPSDTYNFYSSITGLTQNTKYFCRAYIRNSIGTFYGREVIFTTDGDVPVLETDLATEIAVTTAMGYGNIINNGGSAISQHGVCWWTSANPTILGSKTEEGDTDALGKFSSSMTDLLPNTTYHYRAYATNASGTGYGVDRTFTTNPNGAPIVKTDRTINVEGSIATGRGEIVDVGDDPVTQHGHCWSTSANPTTSDSKTENGTSTAVVFTSDITGLTQGTTYYIRAYATNSYGTNYGNNDIIYEVAGELMGNLAYKGEYLVYTSKSGTQRALLGTEF